jgi:hypothetical protein
MYLHFKRKYTITTHPHPQQTRKPTAKATAPKNEHNNNNILHYYTRHTAHNPRLHDEMTRSGSLFCSCSAIVTTNTALATDKTEARCDTHSGHTPQFRFSVFAISIPRLRTHAGGVASSRLVRRDLHSVCFSPALQTAARPGPRPRHRVCLVRGEYGEEPSYV